MSHAGSLPLSVELSLTKKYESYGVIQNFLYISVLDGLNHNKYQHVCTHVYTRAVHTCTHVLCVHVSTLYNVPVV